MGGHDHLNGASSEASLNFCLGDHFHIRKAEETEEETEAEEEEEDDGPACSNCSSPFQWSSHNRSEGGASSSSVLSKSTTSSSAVTAVPHPWTEAPLHPTSSHFSEGTVMKGRFAKLLLGEDMSGCGNGVCSALALSNAITNLAASVFGELWKLGPLHSKSKAMWRREMEWLLAVSDYIVEFVPCTQTYPDGTSLEVMVSRPRSDLYINLPALKKLDMMLLDILESFREVEFCYVDQDVAASGEEESNGRASHSQRRKDEKWWLPTPKVPPTGLLNTARKHLQQQRECVNQIFKAALSINSQILSEMEIPSIYFESLPKSGRATVGEAIYGFISCECFSPETTLCSLDLITEYDALDVANQIETALYIWHQGKLPCNNRSKDAKTKPSWGIVKDLMGGGGGEHRGKELLAKRAENLLLHLKQKFPGLPQTYLDMTKIQYNKDVGQAILESYSRVIESLAFNIMARIEDILYVDDIALESHPTVVQRCTTLATLKERLGFSLSAKTAYLTPLATPSLSITPFPSPGRTTPSDYSAYYGVRRPLSCQASMALEDFSKTSEIESHEASEVDG